jgi:UDP-glucose 4-epimerase
MTKKKVTIIGGSGFIGRSTTDELLKAGYRVLIMDVNKIDRTDVEFIEGSILDKEKLFEATKDAEFVYHYAGWADMSSSREHPYEVIEANIMGTTNVLEACVKNKVGKFIYASSMYVFSKAGSFYKTSKQCCELIIEEYSKTYNLTFCILRYGSLYGPGATHGNGLYELISQAIKTQKIKYWGTGREIRQYIHVSDAAKGAVTVLDSSYDNTYISLTGLEDVKLSDLLEMIKEIFDHKIDVSCTEIPEGETHYIVTPFNFMPKTGQKLVFNSYKDLGQGILECIHEIYNKNNLNL